MSCAYADCHTPTDVSVYFECVSPDHHTALHEAICPWPISHVLCQEHGDILLKFAEVFPLDTRLLQLGLR